MKRLYRSRTHRQIAGVCGGIAEYFGLDPVLVRVIFILMFFAGGSALLAYILAIILIPLEPLAAPAAEGSSPRPAEGGNAAVGMVPVAAPAEGNTAAGAGVLIGGIILIAFGTLFMMRNIPFLSSYYWWFWHRFWDFFWPALLILLGLLLIFRDRKRPS